LVWSVQPTSMHVSKTGIDQVGSCSPQKSSLSINENKESYLLDNIITSIYTFTKQPLRFSLY